MMKFQESALQSKMAGLNVSDPVCASETRR